MRKNLEDASEVPREVLRLQASQYFGERALMAPARRAANVHASGGAATLLHISRAQFEQVMGSSLQVGR